MSVIHNDLLLSTDEATGYNLTKSLRFRSAASAYLNRTPASAGNRKTWTYSAWVKRGTLTSRQCLLQIETGSNNNTVFAIELRSDDKFALTAYDLLWRESTQVLRDPSAWYHLVVAIDTTQATAANRIKMYVNGSQITSFTTSNDPSQNADLGINQASAHAFGRNNNNSLYFDGYFAETNFVDGQQLTPSSFGETDSITGVWKPKRYTGTYGTNGFYLPFTDVATTSGSNAGLGKDFSGNGNYWNTNNISVTSGSTYDSMTDVPTLTSADAANYAVLNPLDVSGSGITLSNGNLNATCSTGSTYYFAKASQAIPTSGGFYWETTISTVGQYPIVGIQPTSRNNVNSGSVYLGYYSDEISWFGGLNEIYQNGVNILSVSSVSNGDVIMVAHNAGKTWIGKNGTWFNSGDPSAGTGNLGSTLSGQLSAAICLRGSTAPVVNANFGQRPFAYTPPTGFKALNTYNLPDSTIVAGNTVMDATTYTGNGSTQSITNAGGFKPDLVWLKQRSTGTTYNLLYDSVRGATKWLSSNATAAEGTIASSLTAFNSNGFSVGADPSGSDNGWNASGASNVAWQWQAGQGTTSSNTSGSITSTVSVNASAGFSIVTFTAPGSGSATVGHGLGVAPKFIITKSRTQTYGWAVYHASIGNTGYVTLNTINGTTTNSIWNNTSPTSTVFSIGSDFAGNDSCVAYCWSEIPGFSKFGSYTGNGSTDGTFIYTGFRPKYFMIKSLQVGDYTHWSIKDSSRSPSNIASQQLYANFSYGEDNEVTEYIDILSNGVKLRGNLDGINKNGNTYIYIAFAENPFKNSLAR